MRLMFGYRKEEEILITSSCLRGKHLCKICCCFRENKDLLKRWLRLNIRSDQILWRIVLLVFMGSQNFQYTCDLELNVCVHILPYSDHERYVNVYLQSKSWPWFWPNILILPHCSTGKDLGIDQHRCSIILRPLLFTSSSGNTDERIHSLTTDGNLRIGQHRFQ